MKNSLLLFSILFILYFNLAEAQPTLPDSSHVLVVYNSRSFDSFQIMNYYKNARGIPASNIVALDSLEPLVTITDPVTLVPHQIELQQGEGNEKEIIVDTDNYGWWLGTTKHAWIYFNEKIAIPIASHLKTTIVNGDTLKNTIRFIVLCRGVPFRVQAKVDDSDSHNANVPVDGLLCFLGETIKNPEALLDLINDLDANPYPHDYTIPNPYYNADPGFTMEHNFIPNHYIGSFNLLQGPERDITLSYLITHLDATSNESSVNVVKNMIDSSIAAINSSGYDWFIDTDPTPCAGSPSILHQYETRNVFNALGIANYFIDVNSETVYTSNPYNKPVMSYISNGTHTSYGAPCVRYFQPEFITSQLNFTYIAGAVFNTAESFNANTLGTYPPIRRDGAEMGQLPEFFYKGGTVGVAQVVHGLSTGGIINDNAVMLPAYALGYTFIEAVYLGMTHLTATRVVVGDPLTRIALPCEPTIITNNTTLDPGNYDCDIIVEEGATLNIGAGVNFIRNAQLIVQGNLNIENNAIVNFGAFSELRLEETAQITTASNAVITFVGNSVCTLNNDFVFDGTIRFDFFSSGTLNINGNSEIAGFYNLNLYGGTKCNVTGCFKLNPESQLMLNSSSILIVEGKLIINTNANLNFNNDMTHYNYGAMQFNAGSVFDINLSSDFYNYGKVYVDEGVTINDNNVNFSAFRFLSGVFISLGSSGNPVIINCPSQPYANQLFFTNLDTLLLSYTTINNGRIIFDVSDGLQKPRKYSISNSRIINSTFNSYFQANSPDNIDISLSDNYFSTTASNVNGLDFIGFNEVQFLRNSIIYSGSDAGQTGIRIFNNRFASIRESEIHGFNNGITQFRLAEDEVITESYEDIEIKNCTIIGVSSTLGMGISIGYGDSQTSGAKIDVNNISNFNSGIFISQPIDFSLGITENIISDYGSSGISLNGGSEATVRGNNIFANESAAENCFGISISQLNNPRILENNIYALGASNPGSGIILISANGEIRNNTIQNHHHGIELGSSSPFIGANTITDNLYYGMYISSDSHPDLSESWVGEERYPLSGYNTIRENGICNQINYSELYLSKSTVTLEKGCNTIADDREEPLNCGYYFLIDGKTNKTINAVRNYWGELNDHNPEGRFGPGIIVDYEGYLEEPCTYSESGGILILATSKGEVYDTIYATGDTPTELTDLESRYATANEYYYNNNYSQAKQEYEGIIQNYSDSTESLQAYNRLFTIANLTNSPPASFTQLKDFYSQNVSNQTDSIMIGTLTHLSDLCLVSAEEYLSAINNFDEIAQQNPNTDIALYRQIDALTTSLLMPQDSSFNKGTLGKYSVDNLSDYTNKLSELLKTRGKSGLKSDEELLPTEYTLYQNYPNPFNPVTTIKYDLPNTSEVTLIIYDILGRKIKELVNTKQQAGRYEIQFNASNLASGVYIYQLVAEKYMQSRKMMLLK